MQQKTQHLNQQALTPNDDSHLDDSNNSTDHSKHAALNDSLPPKNSLRQRNQRIDLLRGISIMLVLLHHFNIPYKLHDTWLSFGMGEHSLITAIARNGNYGVTMFFVISGFLITSHSLDRWKQLSHIDIRFFYWSRVARIVPSLLLLLVIVNLLGHAELKPFMNQAPNGIEVPSSLTNLAALTFWMNVLIIKYGWVNYALGVLWSLSVEEVFYFTFPLACLLFKRPKQFIVFLLFFIVAAPVYRWLHAGDESGAYLYGYFASFDGIAIGCAAALIAPHIRTDFFKQNLVKWLTIALMVSFYLYAPIKQSSTLGISLMALGTAVLILGSISTHNTTGNVLPKQGIGHKFKLAISTLGRYSYELYLFHLIVLGLIKVIAPPANIHGNEKLMLLLVFLLGTLLLGFVIARFYSNPLNRWIRQRFTPKLAKNSLNAAQIDPNSAP